jgi:GDPmannose 4,6-dehydratase
VREFVDLAFRSVGLDYEKYVVVDKDLYRPSEVNILLGDASKAHRVLGWSHQIAFPELVREMVENDCRANGLTGFQAVAPTA